MKVLVGVLSGLVLLSVVSCKSGGKAPDPPELEGSSGEAVLLRYKFNPGDRLVWSSDLDATFQVEAAGEAMDGTMTMQLTGDYVVERVEADGRGVLATNADRIVMDMDMFGMEMHVDTAQPDSAEARAVAELLGRPMSVTVSPRGEVDSSALEQLTAAAALGGPVQGSTIVNTFVPFSEGPVRAGDRMGAGTIEFPGAQGNVAIEASYEVVEISGDGNQVLLRPHFENLSAAEMGPGMRLDELDGDGWLLFDVARGVATASAIWMNLTFSVDREGQTGSGEMEMTWTFRETAFHAGETVADAMGAGDSAAPAEQAPAEQAPAEQGPAEQAPAQLAPAPVMAPEQPAVVPTALDPASGQ